MLHEFQNSQKAQKLWEQVEEVEPDADEEVQQASLPVEQEEEEVKTMAPEAI